MSNIIDVINTEDAIGHIMMINQCDIKQMAIFSRVSKQFNRIVKNDMETHRNKYVKRQILKKIDVITTNKMYSMIKNQGNRKNIYKTLEEYDDDLREVAKQIYVKIYDDIIRDLNIIYHEHIFYGSITNNCYEVYLFGIMEKNILSLLNISKKILRYPYNDCNIYNTNNIIYITIFNTFPRIIKANNYLNILRYY